MLMFDILDEKNIVIAIVVVIMVIEIGVVDLVPENANAIASAQDHDPDLVKGTGVQADLVLEIVSDRDPEIVNAIASSVQDQESGVSVGGIAIAVAIVA